MSLILACVVRVLHDDWSTRLGENRLDTVIKHLAAMPPFIHRFSKEVPINMIKIQAMVVEFRPNLDKISNIDSMAP